MADSPRRLILAVPLILFAAMGLSPAEEKPAEKDTYPLWDGKEPVAEYAKRVMMDPAITLDLGGGVKMELMLIPAGKFVMGSPNDEMDRQYNEEPQYDVAIGRPFYLGKFEVTQEQYEKVLRANPSRFKGAKNPVERVSWDDARAFCKQLSQNTGRIVRLPSEAEWEYACRAGSTTPFHPPAPPMTAERRRRVAELIPRLSSDEFVVREKATLDLIDLGLGVLPLLDAVKTGDPEVQTRMALVKASFQPHARPENAVVFDESLEGKNHPLGKVAWFMMNSDGRSHPVGEKEPNAFGLHDMHGNVWEWVEDDWHVDYKGAPADGSAWVDDPRGGVQMVRGGSWGSRAGRCRSACRDGFIPEIRFDLNVGFRVVASSSPRAP